MIRQLEPGDEAILEAFLLPRLETSMFLISNRRESGLDYDGMRYTGDYVAAFEDGHIVAVMAHFWNGIVITQAPAHLDALWRETLRASGRPLKGIIGPQEQVSALKSTLPLESVTLQLDRREVLYSLALDALLVPEALQTGQVTGRPAELRDVDVLARWRVGYETDFSKKSVFSVFIRVLKLQYAFAQYAIREYWCGFVVCKQGGINDD